MPHLNVSWKIIPTNININIYLYNKCHLVLTNLFLEMHTINVY